MHEIWSFLYVIKSQKEEGAECAYTLQQKGFNFQNENAGFFTVEN